MAGIGYPLCSRINTPFSLEKTYTLGNNKQRIYDRLIRSGWIKGTRILSPLQVAIIVDFLGEP